MAVNITYKNVKELKPIPYTIATNGKQIIIETPNDIANNAKIPLIVFILDILNQWKWCENTHRNNY